MHRLKDPHPCPLPEYREREKEIPAAQHGLPRHRCRNGPISAAFSSAHPSPVPEYRGREKTAGAADSYYLTLNEAGLHTFLTQTAAKAG
jgi:hypothetical protein